MRRIFVAVSGLMLLAILVQFYFAAVGAFDRPRDGDSFALHSITGTVVIPLLSVLATVAAALARAPGRLVGLAIAPLGLVVVQMLLVAVGDAISGGADEDTTPAALAVMGLHAINALFMMGVAAQVVRQARSFSTREPQPAATPAATPTA